MMSEPQEKTLTLHSKARYHYDILDTYRAGIVLLGTEVKSLRAGGGSLQDSYILVEKGEAWLKDSFIAHYKYGNLFNHEEKRMRKLLLRRKEILQLKKKVDQRGVTLIPLSFYTHNGRIKVKLAVARGKKLYDKRRVLKEREHQCELRRAWKER